MTTPILDLPFGERPDPDEFIRAAMAWHFDPDTGSEFWIERAKTLDFDPRADVATWDDLGLFPNVTDELRDVPAEQLIPRGYGPKPDVAGIIESGGTTGAPKCLPLLSDYANRMVQRDMYQFEQYGIQHGKNWLSITPSGPHGAFEEVRRSAREWGALVFAVDMDPRWVKKQISAGNSAEADAYAEHILDQATYAFRLQNIGYLRLTPPVLARIAGRDELVDKINENVDVITWGGASMDADSRDFYRRELFPDVNIVAGFGTTMALGSCAAERLGVDAGDAILDPTIDPYSTFQVRNPDTGKVVEYGERGQLVVHHVSKSFLLPNNAERDSVLRHAPSRADQLGDSIGSIAPLDAFKGVEVIEGVY